MAHCLWTQLPEALEDAIVRLLPQNEVPCTIRLINKAAAAKYRAPHHVNIRLSQPVPYREFQRHWQADLWKSLSRRKKLQALCLIAASGDLVNLDFAFKGAGCVLSVPILESAAAAGHRHVCQWLREQGCPWSPKAISKAACAALRGGHLGLKDWLLQHLPDSRPVDTASLLAGAAEGCDLASLQRLHHDCAQRQLGVAELEAWQKAQLLAAAARSPTPDWRAKLAWLETALAAHRVNAVTRAAAALPDAVDRLRWLLSRGYQLDTGAIAAAAGRGNMPALGYLLDEAGVGARAGAGVGIQACYFAGVSLNGHLAALQALHAHGYIPRNLDVLAAAEGGHVAVVSWLLERLGVAPASLRFGVTGSAALSGSVELLAWLRERGCAWGGGEVARAASGGCEAAVEWLVQHGCPVPEDGDPYYEAATNGDLATLRCLRRLGCPWGSEETCSRCCRDLAPLPALRWMVEQGCPVDWEGALEAVWSRQRSPERRGVVAAWVQEEARRRQ